MDLDFRNASKVVGIKQSRRAVIDGLATQVILARDADPQVTGPIEALCAEKGVPTRWENSMKALGQACGVDVGAAAVALL